MDSLHIAPASADDREWCAQLMSRSEPWITLQRDLEACRLYLQRPGADLFIARSQPSDSPVGFILLAPYGFASAPYIASIGVAPGERGHGVGGQLLLFAESHFPDRRHIFLLVSSFNPRAQQFYRRHGYEFVGELKDYIVPGHSELILHKRLAA